MAKQKRRATQWAEEGDRIANGNLRDVLEALLRHREERAHRERDDVSEEIENFKAILALHRRLQEDEDPKT